MSLYRRPGSPYWWSKLNHNGEVRRFSTGKRKKIEALTVERTEAEKIAKRPKEGGGYLPLVDLAEQFSDWKVANKASGGWAAKIDHYLALIISHFGADADVRTFDDSSLSGYRTARLQEVAAVTVCKELSALRQLVKYAHEERKLIPSAPHVRNPPNSNYEPKWRLLTREELGNLLHALSTQPKRKLHGKEIANRNPELLPYFLLKANTGFRGEGELGKLEWGMVDWAGAKIDMPGRITKTRRARTVELNEQALVALRMLGDENSRGVIFTQKSHYVAWHKAVARAGISGKVRPHDLRHTFGSLMHSSGASQPVIRDLMGHTTLFMANLYAHSYSPDRARAVASVSVGPSVPSVPKNVPLLGHKVLSNVQDGNLDCETNKGQMEPND